MYNQARTLLLNINGSTLVPSWVIGEQPVPANYNAITMPGYLQNIRSYLFGANPDRSFLNYRIAQLLTLIHATELSQYVFALDPRVTYLPASSADLFGAAAFTPAVLTPPGISPLIIQGEPTLSDITGQCYYEFDVIVQSESSVLVRQSRPTANNVFISYTLSGGLSTELIPLGNSGYSFYMPESPDDTDWNVNVTNRPQWDLGQLLAGIQQVSEPTLISLFGVALVEPYATFSTLFSDRAELAYQLGGIVMAMIYRSNEILQRTGSV